MYVNAFLFGVMCTIFAEMALVLFFAQFAPKKKHDEPKRNTNRINKEEK